MKLLFDENLSPRLVDRVKELWPESTHIEALGLRGATDETIWEVARDQGYAIVSKDDDFRGLASVRGAPPKVVWLQVGNASTLRIAQILVLSMTELEVFALDPVGALLALRA